MKACIIMKAGTLEEHRIKEAVQGMDFALKEQLALLMNAHSARPAAALLDIYYGLHGTRV